ncbi:MAG TPA: hypothetical protein VLX68_17170 [Chitinivibrionales bacterium]|nr:hypothetical protein [Chitinivibrionales bacterium]
MVTNGLINWNGKIINIFFLFMPIIFLSTFQSPYASPCDDSLYLELKKRDKNILTQNEMFYMLAKDNQCDQTKKELEAKKAERQQEIQDSIKHEKKYKEISSKVGITILMCLFFTAVITVTILFASGGIKITN